MGKRQKTILWDPARYLTSEETIAAYLNLAMEEDDEDLFQEALGDVARARGMSSVANAAGAGRESLYKSLRAEANPSYKTISKVMRALGLQLHVTPLK